jgi:peptidoglycan/LPS O-acetylase OafA/YrhL
MLSLLLALVVHERTPLTPLFAARPMVRLGRVSYGVYLYHLLGLHVTNLILGRLGLMDPWLVFFAYSCLAWLLAEASFRWWESRFLQANQPSLMKAEGDPTVLRRQALE